MMIYHLNVLKRDNPFTVYHFNIQSLTFDMFKVSNNIVPTIVADLSIRSHYTDNLLVSGVHILYNGQNSIQYYDSPIWNIFPDYIKNSKTLDIFTGFPRKKIPPYGRSYA